MSNKITALAGIKNDALASGELPQRIKVFNWGENPSDKGTFKVTQASITALAEQVAQKSYAEVILDFEHNSLKGHPNYQPPPRHHAAVGTVEALAGDGIYLTNLKYTPSGQKFAKDYPDLSPVPVHTPDGVIIGLLSVALCPNGALHGVTYFSADAPGVLQPKDAAEAVNPQTKDTQMADITALEASIATLTKENEKLRTEITALAGKMPDAAKITALETSVTQLLAKITALETADTLRAKDALIASALPFGKHVALEADVIAQMSVAQLKTYIEKLPVTIPVHRRTPVVTPLDAGKSKDDIVAQYNAITNPKERAAFFKAHKKELGGC